MKPAPYMVHELVRLAQYLKFTAVAQVGMRSGSTLEDVRQAGLETGLSRQGVLSSMKKAGYRLPKGKQLIP